MVFSSFIFLLVFLPLHLLAYLKVPERWRNAVLLVSSLVFYAWGGPAYLFLLCGDTLVAWFCALMASRREGRVRLAWTWAAAVALLGILGYFKYTGFVLGTVQALTGWPEVLPQIVLPIGISFYTFQLISYVVDVYRGRVEAQGAYWKLLLYSSLFHQCIAGPIVRYETVAGEIERRHARGNDLYYGVRRFSVGLAKKTLLANACASVADELLPVGTSGLAAQTTAGLWLGMAFYMLQIYLDFSAYSDMAIGLGRMVGFHYLENFDHPYESATVQEFWRRWHISLGSFFRDYVYIPLGGSRCSTAAYVRNMCVVWLLTGLWHGASWNYVLWGAYYLALLLLERFVIRGRLPRWLGHALTLAAVFFGWVLFKFEDFGELGQVVAGMFGLSGVGASSLAVETTLLKNVFLLAVGCVACTSLGSRLYARLRKRSKAGGGAAVAFGVLEAVVPPVLIVLSLVSLAGASYNPFIYFQF